MGLMEGGCKLSCDKRCGATPMPTNAPTKISPKFCTNKYSYCARYASLGYCTKYNWLGRNCKLSCDKSCSATPAPTNAPTSYCSDKYSYCPRYASRGYCKWLNRSCKLSCSEKCKKP